MDLKTTIQGNQFHTVTGNQTKSTLGSITSTVIGAQTISNFGPQNGTHLAPVTHTYRTDVRNDYHSDWLIESAETGFRGNYSLQEVVLEVDVAIFGLYGQVLAAAGVAGMDLEAKTVHAEEHMVHLEHHPFTPKFLIFNPEAKGAEVKTAALQAGVHPSLNAVPGPPLARG